MTDEPGAAPPRPNPILRSERVYLRALEPADAELVHRWYEHADTARLMGEMPRSLARRRADAEAATGRGGSGLVLVRHLPARRRPADRAGRHLRDRPVQRLGRVRTGDRRARPAWRRPRHRGGQRHRRLLLRAAPARARLAGDRLGQPARPARLREGGLRPRGPAAAGVLPGRHLPGRHPDGDAARRVGGAAEEAELGVRRSARRLSERAAPSTTGAIRSTHSPYWAPDGMEAVVGDERAIRRPPGATGRGCRRTAIPRVGGKAAQDPLLRRIPAACWTRVAVGRALRRDRVVGRRDGHDPVRAAAAPRASSRIAAAFAR